MLIEYKDESKVTCKKCARKRLLGLQKICKRRWHSGKVAKILQASLALREGCKKFASVPDTQGRLQKICKATFSVFLSGEARKALLNITARAEANRGANISGLLQSR